MLRRALLCLAIGVISLSSVGTALADEDATVRETFTIPAYHWNSFLGAACSLDAPATVGGKTWGLAVRVDDFDCPHARAGDRLQVFVRTDTRDKNMVITIDVRPPEPEPTPDVRKDLQAVARELRSQLARRPVRVEQVLAGVHKPVLPEPDPGRTGRTVGLVLMTVGGVAMVVGSVVIFGGGIKSAFCHLADEGPDCAKPMFLAAGATAAIGSTFLIAGLITHLASPAPPPAVEVSRRAPTWIPRWSPPAADTAPIFSGTF